MTARPPLEICSLTNPGCVRSINEDAVAAAPELGLIVVADGMGGHSAGDVAAKLAVKTIADRVAKAPADADRGEVLRGAVLAANRRILRQASENTQLRGMGATVVCLLINGRQASVAHLGDSRAYLLRDGKLRQLTRDHSLTQEVRDLGVIAEDAIASSHNRHLISHALGQDEQPPVAFQQLECMPGDLFLLCTDGLNDMIDGEDIELILRVLRSNLPLTADQLVMIARDNGGYDNITVGLARVAAPSDPAGARNNQHAAPSLLGRLIGWFNSLIHKGN